MVYARQTKLLAELVSPSVTVVTGVVQNNRRGDPIVVAKQQIVVAAITREFVLQCVVVPRDLQRPRRGRLFGRLRGPVHHAVDIITVIILMGAVAPQPKSSLGAFGVTICI